MTHIWIIIYKTHKRTQSNESVTKKIFHLRVLLHFLFLTWHSKIHLLLRLIANTLFMFGLNKHGLLTLFFSKILNPLNNISLYCKQLPLSVFEPLVYCS